MLVTANKAPWLKRNSGVELLRILSMFLIVLAHITQTASDLPSVPIDVATASHQLSHFVLSMFYMFGAWGNIIFFIISAWFLLDSKEVKCKKLIYLVIEVWVLSVSILACFLLFFNRLPLTIIVKCFFPTLFANNWFVTAYILFYSFHTILNSIIYGISQRKLLSISLIMFFLYVICNTFGKKLFFPSVLIFWITIYFTMGYIKFYLPNLSNNRKINICMFLVAILSLLVLTCLNNVLGLKFSILHNQMLYWGGNYSFFWVICAITLLNLFRNLEFRSKFVNKIASYMLLVYLIHENLLFRRYIRPLWLDEYIKYIQGLNILAIIFLFALFVFILSLIIAIVFDNCFKNIFDTLTAKIYKVIKRFYSLGESYILLLK